MVTGMPVAAPENGGQGRLSSKRRREENSRIFPEYFPDIHGVCIPLNLPFHGQGKGPCEACG